MHRVMLLRASQYSLDHHKIMEFISQSCGDLKSIEMPSRASHDAQNFTFCPMGMIFVPSIGGISHSPKEKTTDQMCINGSNVLTNTIKMIDGM